MKTTLWIVGVLGSLTGEALAQSVFELPVGQTSIEFVTVGNAGNAPDPVQGLVEPRSLGAVAYEYRIGKYETTNAQYARFLNSVAASDPNGLWNAPGSTGGINRSGVAGSFTYTLIAGRENTPVNLVSWYDAARFVNWLHNGEGNGSTESGVYTLTGPTSIVGGRSPDARFFLPTENEWYKAAYHQPADQGGDADGFWRYMTGTNTWTATNDDPSGANVKDANGTFWVNNSTSLGFPPAFPYRPVGAYSDAASFYGTFDQGGNASEWNESLGFGVLPDVRGIRGGAYLNLFPNGDSLQDGLFAQTGQRASTPTAQQAHVGFRIGAAIPSPSTSVLGIVTLLAVNRRRRPR